MPYFDYAFAMAAVLLSVIFRRSLLVRFLSVLILVGDIAISHEAFFGYESRQISQYVQQHFEASSTNSLPAISQGASDIVMLRQVKDDAVLFPLLTALAILAFIPLKSRHEIRDKSSPDA